MFFYIYFLFFAIQQSKNIKKYILFTLKNGSYMRSSYSTAQQRYIYLKEH